MQRTRIAWITVGILAVLALGGLLYTMRSQPKQSVSQAASQLTASLIARQAAYNAILDNDHLTYLDPIKQVIITIDQNGAATQLSQPATVGLTGALVNVQSMHVMAGNQAIVQIANTLYLLHNQQLSPLHTDGMPGGLDIKSIAIGANPQQASFVVVINQQLFWYSTPDAVPQKVLTLPKRVDQLAFGGNEAIAYSTALPQASQDISGAYSGFAIDPLAINLTAKTQAVLTTGPIVDASLAPDGQHATIQHRGDQELEIVAMTTKAVLHRFEAPNLTTPYWLDTTRYVYGQGSDLREQAINAATATILGKLPGNLQPTSITYDPSNTSYLITTYNSSDSASIYRLATTDPNTSQAVAATAQKPDALAHYTYQFFDITKPVVIIKTDPMQARLTGSDYKAAVLALRQQATDNLQQQGVDLAQLTIIYSPADPL